MIQNRLEKNQKKLKAWADRHRIEAYRLYDRDIPEFPVLIDRYKDFFVVSDRTDEVIDQGKNQLPETVQALKNLFSVGDEKIDEKIIVKKRERQEGLKQYERMDATSNFFTVQETQARFLVNLYDYLDTGLFLDHRPLRQIVFKQSSGARVLNLFCYTGSFSVFAALGGAAAVTSVDMSATYVEWAKRNFQENGISLAPHSFVQDNALDFLKNAALSPEHAGKYDLIVLDPPTFSNSKRMVDVFEVEKDQEFLVTSCLKLLSPKGILYFSNNKRKFKLSPRLETLARVKDISNKTIPMDFHDQKIHHCFEITNRPG
jgi:23S rRNA (cytosine1962-C5)-methyltransferase/23S rRNA (guanine2445-N2)-methyltransferase / 23S rRNA (guanine2069-N7)-methyltransferase